jgi:hypothetical protein
MKEPIFSILTGKTPINRQITASLANAQTLAGSTGVITTYTKQSTGCCGVGSTIYYIVSWY